MEKLNTKSLTYNGNNYVKHDYTELDDYFKIIDIEEYYDKFEEKISKYLNTNEDFSIIDDELIFGFKILISVSYTHLTLPTICSV